MSDDVILKVENLSKQYRLGNVGTGTLAHDLNRTWHKLRGKEDPYLKIGAVNDRGAKATSDYVWALQDINFEVKRGEILGIIGKNGAGKSTLLKILSRVTSPSTGTIAVGGRMASLLEVGTGMHPELTGRENIYLNGAILGMTKAEIASKIDEIVAFSGCEMYIDTPVKRYSSGMGVRLGFAVAAFLEPDILVVDEVLAVGDAEFQKKAIGKMQDISSAGGRTVLVVSHNMATIQQLCTKCIVLKNGSIQIFGDVKTSIDKYLSINSDFYNDRAIENWVLNQATDVFKLNNILLIQKGSVGFNFYTHKKVKIEFLFSINAVTIGLRIGFDLINLDNGQLIWRTFHDDKRKVNLDISDHVLKVYIPKNILTDGRYAIKPLVGIHNHRWIINDDSLLLKFNLTNTNGVNASYMENRPGVIMPIMNWVHKIENYEF